MPVRDFPTPAARVLRVPTDASVGHVRHVLAGVEAAGAVPEQWQLRAPSLDDAIASALVEAETHGHDFYSEIGHKGGEKVKDLIEKGKEEENR